MGGAPLPYFSCKIVILNDLHLCFAANSSKQRTCEQIRLNKGLSFSEGLHAVFLPYFQYRGLKAWNGTGVTCMDTVGWMVYGLDKAFLGGGLNESTQHSAQTYIFIENKS